MRWSVLLRLDMCALVPLCLDMRPLPCSENGYAATFYQMGSTAYMCVTKLIKDRALHGTTPSFLFVTDKQKEGVN